MNKEDQDAINVIYVFISAIKEMFFLNRWVLLAMIALFPNFFINRLKKYRIR